MGTYCKQQKELKKELSLQLNNHVNGIFTELDQAFPVTEDISDKSVTAVGL